MHCLLLHFQGPFPEGITFLVNDLRSESKRQRSSRQVDLFKSTSSSSLSKKAFQGVGRRLEDRPSSAKQGVLPPLLSPTSSSDTSTNKNSPRPISAPFSDKAVAATLLSKGSGQRSKSPTKKAPHGKLFKSQSSKELQKCNKTTKKAKAKETCYLKVHGIGDSPFLLELVAYDTVKTVRGLLANVVKMEYVKQNRDQSLPNNSMMDQDFKLFMGFPRHLLNDDSKSLGDLGLVPNGVLHLVRNNI